MLDHDFCGSATTGVAALRHNRNFVGIDAEKDYLANMAVKRMGDVLKQRNLPISESALRKESATYLDGIFGSV